MPVILILLSGFAAAIVAIGYLLFGLFMDAVCKTAEPKYTPASRGPVYVRERLIALRRDRYTCRVCGMYPAWITHHIVPRKRGGSDYADNLMTVCPHCHPKVEQR